MFHYYNSVSVTNVHSQSPFQIYFVVIWQKGDARNAIDISFHDMTPSLTTDPYQVLISRQDLA